MSKVNDLSDKNANQLNQLRNVADKAKVSESPVYSFMGKNTVSIVDGTKIHNAIQALAAHSVGSAPVVNKQGKIMGIISEHDLLLQTATKDVTDPITYTKEVITVTADSLLKDVLLLLYKKKIIRIPVVAKDNTICGIVTRTHVLLKLIGKVR